MKNDTLTSNTMTYSMTDNNQIDDLQFRRNIYADPSTTDEVMLSAQKTDPSKKQLAQELCQLDKKIQQALAVPVPDELCNKLLLRQTLAVHQQQKHKKRLHLALAASVAILAGVVINYLQFSSTYTNSGDYALAHVYHEKNDFSNTDNTRVSLTTLNDKMGTFKGQFTGSMGELISADYCRFDGMKSLHLVFQGVTDIVTVFVIPQKEHLAFINRFNDDKLQGESLRYANADILVVADKNESLSDWQNTINKNITWSI